MNSDTKDGVLNGIRVVELATVVAAPSCGALLCDFGANVVKVESPKGDPWRKEAVVLAPKGETFGNLFENSNRGKMSVVLNLKEEKDVSLLLEMLRSADVFLTNVRTRALNKLGLNWERLRHKFPRLIYAQLTAWGRTGPKRDEAGYDAGAFWAATGIQDITRASDDAPPSRYPGGIGDHTTGLAMLAGISMALFSRERTGKGQLVDASLLRTGAWVNSVPLMLASGANGHRGARGQRRGRADYSNPTFNAYRTKDGVWIQLLGLETARHLRPTLECLQLDHLLSKASFSSLKMVLRNRRELMAAMSEKFASQNMAHWESSLRAHNVWFTPMRRFEEVMSSDDLIVSGGVDNVQGISHGLVSSPVKLSAYDHRSRGRAPKLGAHTEQVLSRFRSKL